MDFILGGKFLIFFWGSNSRFSYFNPCYSGNNKISQNFRRPYTKVQSFGGSRVLY